MAAWKGLRLGITEFVFRLWYRIVNKLDRKGEVVFMNYGFCNGVPTVDLPPEQESNRLGIQLYDQLVSGVDLEGKEILEVGSGRGGGLAFLTNRYQPIRAVGMDLDKTAIRFCNKYHGTHQLSFLQGNAQKLPFDDNSMDVVINVESSHRYESMKSFLSEVKRVLKPGGSFLITDFRYDTDLKEFIEDLENSGLKKIKEAIISPFVVESLKKDDARRRDLVQRLVPGLLRKPALEFAGVVGSKTFEAFATGKWTYHNYHLVKHD